MLREYLEDNVLITDGAMGTYYSQITDAQTTLSELANIENPQVVRGIHDQYIEAGAKLIRTNTFSTNSFTLNRQHQDIRELISRGFDIARSAAKDYGVFVAADIGPIPEIDKGKAIDKNTILAEYLFIVEVFLNSGAEIFILETFSSTNYIKEISEFIKLANPGAYIIAQFTLDTDGYTRKGISYKRIRNQISRISSIDAYGFNCGIGPTHLYNILKNMDFASNDIISALPNSGYPVIINERTVYTQNPQYFADKLMDIRNLGVKIIGGCCGTTPLHIKQLSKQLNITSIPKRRMTKVEIQDVSIRPTHSNPFENRLKKGEFVIAAELAPPFSINLDKVVSGAKELRDSGVDIVTVSDSPMAEVRMDSVMVATKIKREVGIETMPHICCRDKNIIALKSALLGAHMEGIRNLLIITGDPIPSPERVDIKSVFNLNSIKLMEMAWEMNQEIFASEPYFIGGAFNLNVLNKDVELKRMLLKAKKGAEFFLTQPIFQDDVIDYLRTIKSEHEVRVLAGIMPIVSFKNAIFLNNEVPGIDIPVEYIKRFSPNMPRQEAESIGIDMAVDTINKIKPIVDGIYFITPFYRTSMIASIINKSLG